MTWNFIASLTLKLVYAVGQLVDVLRYNRQVAGALIYSFRPLYGYGVGSVSDRHEYGEYLLGVKVVGA